MLLNSSRLLLLGASLVLTTLGGCDQPESVHEESEHRLLVTQPLRQDTALVREYVCQIHSNRHIEVRALERGYLQGVSVKEGQLVAEGDHLFKIQPLTYQADLQRAQAEAEAARLDYENTRRLAENNVVSKTELALSKAKYDQQRAEVNLAQAHLGFTDIRAPFSGLVDRLKLREGSLVEEGDLLTTLSDNSQMWVYFNVPESEYLQFARDTQATNGLPVELVMANGEIFPEQGRIAVIEAVFNNETGTVPFRADFSNPKGLLRHGETGNIRLRTPLPNALLIPQKSTFEVLDQHYVFVLGKDDIVEQRRVRIAEELEDVFVIQDGLTDTDRIVLEGLRYARNGRKAAYDYIEPEAAFADLKVPAE